MSGPHIFNAVELKPESTIFKTLWSPDQVRDDDKNTFYDFIDNLHFCVNTVYYRTGMANPSQKKSSRPADAIEMHCYFHSL